MIVGRITGVWGLRGDVKVQPLTDSLERFQPGSTLFIDTHSATIERSRWQKTVLVIKFEAISGRDAAECFRGRLLTVTREDVPPLPAGQFYHYQLIDMEVISDKGECLGRVSEILITPGNDVYVVSKNGRRDLLLPSLAEVVLDVDLDANRMTVHLLDGLS